MTAALALLFFCPLAAVYARHVAHVLRRAILSGRSSVTGAVMRRLILPAVVAVGFALAVAGRPAVVAALPPRLAASGTILWALDLWRQLGEIALIFFFVAVPYVMGSLLGAVAAALGYPRVPAAPTDPADATAP
ncbi:hypothetical protein [Mangrovibrevibacter kandeliae]|uniref:hypothetical protein n=1 Tax=Mangrovibrevibacter kandeliae TaxID=2968473 RepID=UPI0021198B94|nr:MULTISPECIES: hypothetical protein [unclassified Aurantimonas]MCQ8782357.1 hypothetical protein [Aurantimonas sp. CSK15Z-1]MCW4114996.1 hypothetical protein [Aurantimonas sp. MSK8Z-1]